MNIKNISKKTCCFVGCKNKIKYNSIKTSLGYFCSKECQEKVSNNIFKVLSNLYLLEK